MAAAPAGHSFRNLALFGARQQRRQPDHRKGHGRRHRSRREVPHGTQPSPGNQPGPRHVRRWASFPDPGAPRPAGARITVHLPVNTGSCSRTAAAPAMGGLARTRAASWTALAPESSAALACAAPVHLERLRPGSTRGLRSVSTRTPARGPTPRMGAARHADGMNINMYVINAILVLMVVRQIREHPLDLRALAVPVLAVGAAAVMFLHSVPGGGNDIALELARRAGRRGHGRGRRPGHPAAPRRRRPAAGPGGRCWRPACGSPGWGRRLAFAFAATHGAGPAIARFSIAHHITGSAAWVAALVMMALADVLTRLAVIYLRGRRLAAAPGGRPGARSRLAPMPDLVSAARRGPHCVREGTAGRGGPYSWRRAARAGACRGRGRGARFGPGGASAIARPRARCRCSGRRCGRWAGRSSRSW